jgi:L-lactate dehydrogenase complex protein LldG
MKIKTGQILKNESVNTNENINKKLDGKLFDKFRERLALNGATALVCASHAGLAAHIKDIAAREKNSGGRLVFHLSARLASSAASSIETAIGSIEGAYITNRISDDNDIFIVPASAVLVEDGALAVDSALCAHEETLFGDICVLIADGAEIYENIIDFFAAVSAAKSSIKAHNITIIAGPSKTADIEKQIVTGMHGPKKLYCIVISD